MVKTACPQVNVLGNNIMEISLVNFIYIAGLVMNRYCYMLCSIENSSHQSTVPTLDVVNFILYRSVVVQDIYF